MHILPRIKAMLGIESRVAGGSTSSSPTPIATNSTLELDGVCFKAERMYRHNVMRINFTSYDVRRGQDTINPNTEHCNVMLLASRDASISNHQYVYARVLGIYHINVIYTGPGMLDYRARRVEFLWVRWFRNLDDDLPVQDSWTRARLDRLDFPPMDEEDAFGFVDPAHVLRGCHLIQAFSAGMRHLNQKGVSECARNAKDWRLYYVNRYVATDNFICYSPPDDH